MTQRSQVLRERAIGMLTAGMSTRAVAHELNVSENLAVHPCTLWTMNTGAFIDGILNTPRHRDEILWPIVVPFIHNHHLMLQHDNAWPRLARICTLFLEAENIPVLVWPAYSLDMSPIEHVWDALDRRIDRQRVPVPANIQQLRTAIEEEWTNIPQATTWSTLWRRCVALREANGGHTRYWLVFGPPNTVKLHILEWPFIVASLRHTCAIIMLSNQHLDMPHLWGGWIISAKVKCSLTQI